MKQTLYYEIRVVRLQYIGAYHAQYRTLILTVKVAILATIVPCCVSFGQAEPSQRSGGIPADLLATFQNDLKTI